MSDQWWLQVRQTCLPYRTLRQPDGLPSVVETQAKVTRVTTALRHGATSPSHVTCSGPEGEHLPGSRPTELSSREDASFGGRGAAAAGPIRVKPRTVQLSSSGDRMSAPRTAARPVNSGQASDTPTSDVVVVPLPEPDDAWAELRIEVQRCRRYIERLRRQISRALDRGDGGRALRLQDLLLKSASGRLWAAFEADHKLRKKDRRRPRDADLVREVANRMRLYEPCAEEVRVSFKRKSSGQCRPICSYGLENRARQYLAKFAFEPFSAQGTYQFDSRDKAIEHVSSALSRGFKWVVQVDLKDCFASLDIEGLAELIPLPRRVSLHTLAEPPGDARVLGSTPGNSILLLARMWTRLGLPQGSASSSAVANHLIALALKELPALGEIAFYVDDGRILVRTKREAEHIKDALYRVFSVAGPVGSIGFKYCTIRRAADGFDFLGYRIQLVKGLVVCIPSEGKTAVVRAVVSHFLSLNKEHAWLREHVRGWCAAHRHWQHVDAFRDRLLRRIDAAEQLGYDPSPPHRTETVELALHRVLGCFPEDKRTQFFDALAAGQESVNRIYGTFSAW